MQEGDIKVTAEEESRLKLEVQQRGVDAVSLAGSSLIATHNPILQINALRLSGNKTRALMMLQKITSSKLRKAVALEIISTYVYFGDFKGALERYQSIMVKSFELDKLRALLEIHVSEAQCGDQVCLSNKHKIAGILAKQFDLDAFRFFLEYTEASCKKRGCVGKKCFLEALEILGFLRCESYAKRLSFLECSEVRKYVRSHHIEKQRLLCNPWVPAGDVYNYFKRYHEDLELLRYIAERRHLNFLLKDKRLKYIKNDTVMINIKRSHGMRMRPIKTSLFDNLRPIPKCGNKYFRFL